MSVETPKQPGPLAAVITGAGTGIGAAVARRPGRRREHPSCSLAGGRSRSADVRRGTWATQRWSCRATRRPARDMTRVADARHRPGFGGVGVLGRQRGRGPGPAPRPAWTTPPGPRRSRSNLTTCLVAARALPARADPQSRRHRRGSPPSPAWPPRRSRSAYVTAKHGMIGPGPVRWPGTSAPAASGSNTVLPGLGCAPRWRTRRWTSWPPCAGWPAGTTRTRWPPRRCRCAAPAGAGEVAEAIAFLAGPQASAVTGAVLTVGLRGRRRWTCPRSPTTCP